MRECGSCDVCCTVAAVPALSKPAHAACPHSCGGCELFGKEERPQLCSDFTCMWKRGCGEEGDRPDLSGVMVTANELNGGKWIFVIELWEDACQAEGRRIVLDAVRRSPVPAIVVEYGSLPPDDRGDLTLVKEELKDRTKRMRGFHIGSLSRDVGIYKLRMA